MPHRPPKGKKKLWHDDVEAKKQKVSQLLASPDGCLLSEVLKLRKRSPEMLGVDETDMVGIFSAHWQEDSISEMFYLNIHMCSASLVELAYLMQRGGRTAISNSWASVMQPPWGGDLAQLALELELRISNGIDKLLHEDRRPVSGKNSTLSREVDTDDLRRNVIYHASLLQLYRTWGATRKAFDAFLQDVDDRACMQRFSVWELQRHARRLADLLKEVFGDFMPHSRSGNSAVHQWLCLPGSANACSAILQLWKVLDYIDEEDLTDEMADVPAWVSNIVGYFWHPDYLKSWPESIARQEPYRYGDVSRLRVVLSLHIVLIYTVRGADILERWCKYVSSYSGTEAWEEAESLLLDTSAASAYHCFRTHGFASRVPCDVYFQAVALYGLYEGTNLKKYFDAYNGLLDKLCLEYDTCRSRAFHADLTKFEGVQSAADHFRQSYIRSGMALDTLLCVMFHDQELH